MKRRVACLVCSIPLIVASPVSASVDDWTFFEAPSPIFIDARDAVSWDAGRSIGAGGDVALQEIRADVRITRPAMPAYEPGTA
ncbi:MAG TPA: hypothetical protein VFB36_09035 [Nevskiaceae bacterium]|nr:hypothetical protein [Nevskiaceae bacterium]